MLIVRGANRYLGAKVMQRNNSSRYPEDFLYSHAVAWMYIFVTTQLIDITPSFHAYHTTTPTVGLLASLGFIPVCTLCPGICCGPDTALSRQFHAWRGASCYFLFYEMSSFL